MSGGAEAGRCAAQLALDGDTRTAWCQEVRGPGDEPRLRITLPADAAVRQVDLVSGGMRPGEIDWQDVGHATEARLSAGDNQQFVPLHPTRRPPRERVRFDPPWRTRELVITLRGLAPGKRHPGLICLGEVSIWID